MSYLADTDQPALCRCSLQMMVQPFIIRPVALAQYYEVGHCMQAARECMMQASILWS